MFGIGQKKVPKSSASVLFIFIALVGTLLLIAAVLSIKPGQQATIEETPQPKVMDANDALPSGVGGAVRRLEIDATINPTVLFAYREDAQQMLALVHWDYRQGKYVLRSRLATQSEQELPKLPRLKLVQTGWGNGSTIEARWPLAERGRQAIAYIQIDGQLLKQMSVQRSDGERRLELLESGDTEAGEAVLAVQDLDGDGVGELVQTVTDESGNTSVDVFLWADDGLAWNQQWSQAMTARVNLFPEPESTE